MSSGTSLREYRKLFNSINCGGNEVEGVMDVWSLKKVCFQIKLHILSWNIEACMIKMTWFAFKRQRSTLCPFGYAIA